MNRAVWVSATGGLLALTPLTAPTAVAEPPQPSQPAATSYLIGPCFEPSQPVQEKPSTVVYGCDHTSVMESMSWTTWGADGATGAGVDNAIECQPNCAQGRRLTNPIVVHAWNPLPPSTPGCPAGVDFYRDFTVAYPEGVPPWVKPGTSWTEDVAYTYVDGMPAVHFSNQEPFSCAPAPN